MHDENSGTLPRLNGQGLIDVAGCSGGNSSDSGN